MPTLILLRHARSQANGSGILAGRTVDTSLDDAGWRQAHALVDRLVGVPIAAIVSSPQRRCQETIATVTSERGITAITDPALAEVDYGEWTGKNLTFLAKEPLWEAVRHRPSTVIFPGGEGLAAVQARAVAAIRAHDHEIAMKQGANAVWLACTHGDVIKSVIADALGLHLDKFQRIVVDPCSISILHYTNSESFVLRINDSGGDLGVIIAGQKQPVAEINSGANLGGTTGTS